MTKRYIQFSDYLKARFGQKTWKLPIDGGATCPNLDGTLGSEGCLFCDNRAFASLDPRPPLEQARSHMRRIQADRNAQAFIVYFQSFTNTYASIEVLKARWDEVAALEGVVGLAVGTRPDCVGDDVLDLLAGYTDRLEVWLELGVQSMHDATLAWIGRGHSHAQSEDAICRAAERGLKVSVHLIFGLPGETPEMILQTVERMARLPIQGVKIHPLQVLRGTRLETLYQRGEVSLLPREAYLDLVCDAIERLPRSVVIQRLTAEADLTRLVAPLWGIEKMAALNEIDRILESRGTFQGSRFEASSPIHSIHTEAHS